MENSLTYLFNTSTYEWEPVKVITWKAVVNAVADGITLLHDPGTKTFRLLGGHLVVSPLATTGGGSIIELRDGATDRIAAIGYLGTAANTQSGTGPIVIPIGGIVSSTAGNDLNLNLVGGLTAGEVVVTVWGCDE